MKTTETKKLLVVAGLAIAPIAVLLLALATGWVARPGAARAQDSHDHDDDDHDKKGHDEDGHDHGAGEDDHGKEGHDDGKEGHEGHGGHDDHEGEDRHVRLSAEERREFGIELASAGPGELHVSVSLPGEVVLNANRVAHIVPRASGIATAVQKNIGDLVEANEPLATVESAELGGAIVEYLAKLQQLELTRTDLDRAKAVHDNTRKLLDALAAKPDATADPVSDVLEGEMGANRSMLLSARAELVFALQTRDRERQLFEKKIGSEAELLSAESALTKAQAHYAAERDSIAFAIKRVLLQADRAVKLAELDVRAARHRLLVLGLPDDEVTALTVQEEPEEGHTRYSVRSAFAGTVIDKHVSLGERVDDETEAFTIADLRTVWVHLTVYQKDLATVRSGQKVRVRAEQGGQSAQAKIDYVSPIVAESTRTATARVVLENAKGDWRPGMFVTGNVELSHVEAPVVVRRSAVQTIDGKAVVFVEEDGQFEPRPIEIGRADAESLEVVSGLSAGDRYVVKNAFTLKAELGKGSFGDGHAH